ncbi:MAG: hypothetical protein RIC15_01295 [Vicingaceae bacterium]
MADEPHTEQQDNIRGVTLRVAIFFGLTTFTLCIAMFYIDSILDDTRAEVIQKDSVIQVLKKDVSNQASLIKENERQINVLKNDLKNSPQPPAAE